ncbi:ATP-grasp domain-containing protein [Paenibacillus sp. GYB003]|uniref:ATP-grasp domain-containing protein n=1 Tax=Paenibacillus sp. GYB003 TaxID=2994392 RepID=UPI002F96D849
MTTKTGVTNGGDGRGGPGKRPKVLLTGGRAPVALEMARLLAAAGCEVHVAESMRRYLCRVSNAVAGCHEVPGPAYDPEGFVNGLERIVRRERIDRIVPTCEELFYVASGLERLERWCRVFAAPLDRLRRLHSKWAFIRRVEELGFAVPATRLLPDPSAWSDRRAASASAADGEPAARADGCVLKPEFSRSGAKVRFIRADDRWPPVPEERSFPWVAQHYVRGRGLCTYSVAHDGKLAAHAAYAVDYSVRGGACFYFEPLRHAALTKWVSDFVRLERFTGQIAFDFIETADGALYPIECNPRTTSGIHLFGPDDRLADALLDPESLGDTIAQPRPGTRKMLALPMLALGWRGRGSRRGLREWLRKLASARDVVYSRDDPRPFREQWLMLNELRRIARARGLTMLEASTADIEWNGSGGLR